MENKNSNRSIYHNIKHQVPENEYNKNIQELYIEKCEALVKF